MSAEETLKFDAAAESAGAPADSTPAWFRGKRAPAATTPKEARPNRFAKPALPAIETDGAEPEPLTWRQQLMGWSKSCAVSLGLHAVILVVLSIFVIGDIVKEEFSTVVHVGEEESVSFDDVLMPEIEITSDALEESDLPQLEPIGSPAEMLTKPVDVEATIQKAVGDGDGGELLGGEFKFKMPQSGKAVTKGSFTAWTVPEDPLPRNDYMIIIQIKLPSNIRRLRRADLSGTIVGTDGYRQEIPNPKAGYLPISNGVAQLTVKVPGAAQLVQDSIRIESKLLGEKQELEIVF